MNIFLNKTKLYSLVEMLRQSLRANGSEFQQTCRWFLLTKSTCQKKNIPFLLTLRLISPSTSNGEKTSVYFSNVTNVFLSSGDCMTRLHKFLRDEDFERAVLLLRAGRICWPDTECFGAQDVQPEDELMLMKEIYLADLDTGKLSAKKSSDFPLG